jgi:phage gp29-like protein
VTGTALVPFQAPPPPALVDSSGRPLRTAAEVLTSEIAAAQLAGMRNIWSSHPAQGLDPARLTQILRQAETGDATAYLELAEEIEEKYLHYQSLLGTRKRAVSQLPINVAAASEEVDDEADAQLVRDWLDRLTLQGELFDILDALGKGVSATEIIWETSPEAWLPGQLKWRFPQFFEFDQVTGEQLLLRGGIDGTSGLPQPLPPYKFIIHTAQAKSGLPIRGGLARGVAWFYLFTNFTIKDWLTFLEVYGLPLRVGKYQNGTSEDDIRKLAQAVAQIGSDAGCVIPQSMMIDFVTSNGGTSNPEMFEKLCKYADDQVAKAVLGQTSSADAKSGGLGSGQANLHGEVRDDIKNADAMQLSVTLTRDVAIPIVMFNRGVRRRYPKIIVGAPDQVDVEQAIKSMQAGVALGVPIAVSTYRKLTGLPEPKAGEDLLAAPAPNLAQEGAGGVPGPDAAETPPDGLLGPSFGRKSANGGRGSRPIAAAAELDGRDPDSIDVTITAAIGDLPGLEGAFLDQFDELIASATSLDEVKELIAIRAGDILAGMDDSALVTMGERLGFSAKIAGLIEAPGR